MNRPLKKSLPSRPMNPASRNPAVISFHNIDQSLRKLCATSDHASSEVSRSRSGHLLAGGLVLMTGLGLLGVLSRLLLEAR